MQKQIVSPHSKILLVLLLLVALGFVVLALFNADYSKLGEGFLGSRNASCVGIVRINGVIESGSSSGFLSRESTRSQDIADALKAANEENGVGAILLEINSPGGGAVASKETFDEIVASKKPVVAYLGEIAASGGYYAAAGASYIVANPNSLTGSIGARADLLNYEELLSKIGVRQESIKSGSLKDIGAPYRNITQEEREILSSIINESFQNFRDDVQLARGDALNKPLFNKYLDARVLSAKQALQAGLIDEIGGRRDALMRTSIFGNVSVGENGLPEECVFEEEGSLLSNLLSKFSSSFAQSLASSLQEKKVGLRYEA